MNPIDLENHDEDDVKAALQRDTQDGPAFSDESELPESDFESFAEEGVEKEEGQ